MKLLAKKPQALVLDEGAVLDGYTVERAEDSRAGSELRYAVTAKRGAPATLLLSRRPFADREERARFKRVAALRTRFKHRAAIEVSDFGEHMSHPYLVTEPYDGTRTFGDLLDDEAPLEPERLVELLEPVALALDLAHSQGLVHEALGADSLLVVAHDRLLLDSFGLFELGGESPWTTLQRADHRYRAPEQVRAEPLGPSGNVYSLAALIVHALTGEPPYSGDPIALNYAQATQPPPAVSERAPHLDPAIDPVIEWAMAKHPARRPSSATQLLAQVAEALDVPTRLPAADPVPIETDSSFDSDELPAPVEPPREPARRAARATVAIAAVVAAVCGGVLALALDPFGGDASRAQPPSTAVWTGLDGERAGLRAELASAETPREQADVAGRLAGAYDEAARAAGPGVQARAARAVSEAYTALAAAAEAGDKSRYAEASEAIAQAEQRLQARR